MFAVPFLSFTSNQKCNILVNMIIYFPSNTLHVSLLTVFSGPHSSFFNHILLISSNFILHIPGADTLAFSLSKASFVLKISHFGQTQYSRCGSGMMVYMGKQRRRGLEVRKERDMIFTFFSTLKIYLFVLLA